MKGDFSRLKFNPVNYFRGVMIEQGRVQLDSDWNEADTIANYLQNLTSEDVIGPDGTPANAKGFLLTPRLLQGDAPMPSKAIMKPVFKAPANFPTATAYLENGIVYLNATDSVVSQTQVYGMGAYLVFLAGDGETPITFEETDQDQTTVYQLGLDNVLPVNLFAYRHLEDEFELTSKKPQMTLAFTDDQGNTSTPTIVQFQSVPKTPTGAAIALQSAIRQAAPAEVNFAQAFVLVRDRQLVVVPGDGISLPNFQGTIDDPTTVNELLLGDTPGDWPITMLGSRSESLANFPRNFTNPEPAVQIIYGGNQSFELKLTTFDTCLTSGRFYQDGLLAQNLVPNLAYEAQPFLPGAHLPTALGDYQVFLMSWLRNVNDVQYPGIREVALGGPDTSTRTQAVWQVRLRPSDVPPADPRGKGQMMARLEAGNPSLGNHFYLIEIQHGGTMPDIEDAEVTPVTIKWSRSNGAVVFGILNVALAGTSATMILDNLGQDISLSLKVGDWLELCCDYYLLRALPAPMVRIESLDPDRSTIVTTVPSQPSFPMVLDSFFAKGFVRRWDQKGTPDSLVQGAIPLSPGSGSQPVWVDIENGIQVAFSPGTFAQGAYWNFTSRMADNAISWPVGDDSQPLPLPPDGPKIHTCNLGDAKHTNRRWTFTPAEDLPVFEDLTQISVKVADIDAIKKELAELKAMVEAMEAQVEANTQAIAELDEKVDELNDTVAQLQTQVEANTQAIAQLNSRVETLESQVEKLMPLIPKVEALEQAVSHITEVLETLKPLPAQVDYLENHAIFNGNQGLAETDEDNDPTEAT